MTFFVSNTWKRLSEMKKIIVALAIVLIWTVSTVVAWYGLNELTTVPVYNDQFLVLDVSDTTLAATGTQKYVTWSNMLKWTFLNKTADYTVTTSDVGIMFTNFGATGTITFTLPECTSTTLGLRYPFLTVAAYQIRVDPHANDSISDASDGEAGEYVYGDSVKGSAMNVICIQETMSGTETDAYNWMTFGYVGTWTDQD